MVLAYFVSLRRQCSVPTSMQYCIGATKLFIKIFFSVYKYGMCGNQSEYMWNSLIKAPCICPCNTNAKINISVSHLLRRYPKGNSAMVTIM